MECPEKTDLISFIMEKYLSYDEAVQIKQHLRECDICRTNYAELKGKIDRMMLENKQECEMYRARLMQFHLESGKIPDSKHIEECDACRALNDIVEDNPEFEKIVNLDFPVPESLTNTIDSLLSRKGTAYQENPAYKLKEFFKEKEEHLFEKVVLFLTPAPQPAFLGKRSSGVKNVEFTGKSIVIATGKAHATVKIYSIKNTELESKKTDEEGIVVFENFLPGKYKILVENHKISQLNYFS